MRLLPTLPLELLEIVTKNLDQKSIKRLRLVCKELNWLAEPLLFETVYFNLYGDGVDNLLAVATHDKLRHHVRTLVLKRDEVNILYGPVPCASRDEVFVTWCHAYCNGIEERLLNKSSHEDRYSTTSDIEDECGSNCSFQKMENFWSSYESAMARMHEATKQLTDCIRFRDPENPATRPHVNQKVPSDDLDAMTQYRLHRFDNAIAQLPRLRTFLHEPLFTAANGWRTTWKGQPFSYKKIIEGDARGAGAKAASTEEILEALHLSLTLRALSLRAAASAGTVTVPIQRFRIDVRNIGFWTPDNLARLWDWERACTYVHWPTTVFTNPDMCKWTKQMGGRKKAAEQTERFVKELETIRCAFSEVRELEMNVQSRQGAAEVADGVFRLLQYCGRMERLRLMFAEETCKPRLGNWIGRRVIDMVAQTPDCCWPKLRRLELVGFVGPAQSLLEMLKTRKRALRNLMLVDCRLNPEEGCWVDVFRGLATHLRLEAVHFSRLEEGEWGTIVMDSGDAAWAACQDGKARYGLYETAVYDYVLGRWATLPPLDPKTFLEHRKV